jgi:gliding motility-associated lipoprotein GldH
MKKIVFSLGVLMILAVFGCSDNNDVIVYHKFNNQIWTRFDILSFKIPVNPSEKTYDVSLFVHHTAEFEFDYLDFNMIMTTPSGEERINEYKVPIKKKDGGFIGKFERNSCEVTIALKKEIKLTKGFLSLEIENLVPRLQVKGLVGVGIRLHPVR